MQLTIRLIMFLKIVSIMGIIQTSQFNSSAYGNVSNLLATKR